MTKGIEHVVVVVRDTDAIGLGGGDLGRHRRHHRHNADRNRADGVHVQLLESVDEQVDLSARRDIHLVDDIGSGSVAATSRTGPCKRW